MPNPHDDKISIHIDGKQVFAPRTPMSGTELRSLVTPPIGADRDLFLKVPGPGDDRRVGNGEPVALEPGIHFYSAPSTINPGSW